VNFLSAIEEEREREVVGKEKREVGKYGTFGDKTIHLCVPTPQPTACCETGGDITEKITPEEVGVPEKVGPLLNRGGPVTRRKGDMKV